MGEGSVKRRESGLELFRIVSMLLIVAHHYVVNSGLLAEGGAVMADPSSWRSVFLLMMGAWGKTGINCFVLITGYFMCTSRITVRKFARLFGEVLFYRLILWAVFTLAGYEAFSLKGFAEAALPFTFLRQNFVGCFLVFYLCIPFLNILIRNMSKRQHQCILGVLGFAYILFGSVPGLGVDMNYVSWFAVVYLIAAYLRLYPCRFSDKGRFWGVMTLASVAVSAASIIGCIWLGERFGRFMPYYFLGESNKILTVVVAVCAFMFFRNLKLGYSGFINTVGASAFGVLLIHAGSDTMRRWLWVDLLDNVGMYSSPLLILHAVGSVIAIFAVCTALDQIRLRLVETPCMRIWDRLWDKACARFGWDLE